MQEIVVIDGEISLENTLDGEVELEAITDLDPEVVLSTGGAVYPHYSGSYIVTPSSSVQTLDTSDKVMDDDVTVQAVAQGSATTPATIITADPTISVSSGGLITATVSKTQQITPTVVEGYVSAGTPGNVGVSGSNTQQLTVQSAQTIHPASTDQSIASGKYLTGAQTFKAVTVSGLTADKILQGNVVKIGDADDDDRIMSVTGTASGGITPTGTKQITQNGTNIDVYNYQYADVAVPNSYSAGDEGKVVSNGALVAQTSDTVTQNGTVDTTLINSLTVNVSGGSSDENFEKLLNATLVTVDNSNLTSLRNGAFANSSNLETVNLPNVTSATHNIFNSCGKLREVHMPKWTGNIGNDCFLGDSNLVVFDAPNITQAGQNAFSTCNKLTLQILPKFTTMNGNILFRWCAFTVMVLPMLTTARTNMILNCNNCVTVDIGENLASIPAQMLNGNAVLENIVLRRTSSITALSNANGLWGNTSEPPVHKKIYVLSALISTYQTATNWATHYNAGYITFHAIEGSAYETTYADGTPISS